MEEKNSLEVERRFDKVDTDVAEWKTDLEELKAGLSLIIKKMDEYQEENRRYFNVLLQQHRTEMGGVGEGDSRLLN